MSNSQSSELYGILVIICLLITVWDGLTTALGTYHALGQGGGAIALSIIVALGISGLLLATAWIMASDEEFIFFPWVIALGYSFMTSLNGNMAILESQVFSSSHQGLGGVGFLVLVICTFVTTGAPIFLSHMLRS